MKRRNFFKNLGLVVGALIIAPKLFSEEIEVNEIKYIPTKYKNYDGTKPMYNINDEVGVWGGDECFIEAEITDAHNFKFTKKHKIRVGDSIFVSGVKQGVMAMYVVTESEEYELRAIPREKGILLSGKVSVSIFGRDYRHTDIDRLVVTKNGDKIFYKSWDILNKK